jgi:hypothetical protein
MREARQHPPCARHPVCSAAGVLANLTVSGVECVEALCTAGFRVRRRGAGQTLLERGARTLVVPDRLVLSADLLDAILVEADLSIERFVWLLGEVTTETEIPCDP